jgi:hypothetical protein
LLHIADATADAVLAAGLSQVGLLGTRFTMEQAFMRDHLAARGIQCLVPEETGRAEVHRIIFEELCQGKVLDGSRQNLIAQVQQLAELGAQGVILGCTELTMSLQPGDGGFHLVDEGPHSLADLVGLGGVDARFVLREHFFTAPRDQHGFHGGDAEGLGGDGLTVTGGDRHAGGHGGTGDGSGRERNTGRLRIDRRAGAV